MQRIRSQNTGPELKIRRYLYNMGYRYRIHVNGLPGKPDIVFPTRKKVIFIHGCFWHQHEDRNCRFAHIPQTRQEYWLHKLGKTRQRDIDNLEKLRTMGWTSLILWECQLEDIVFVAEEINRFVGSPKLRVSKKIFT